MLLRSERSNTILASLTAQPNHVRSLNDLSKLLNTTDVKRVQLDSASVYRKQLISDAGSQFTVYTDDGVKRYDQPVGVVKSAKFRINTQGPINDEHAKRFANDLYRELLVLTNPSLRNHENIVKLLYYDLVQESDQIVVPALIIERATFGSLEDFLGSHSVPVSQDDRMLICQDLTQGLLAIHNCGIAHGDVKAANALVFEVSDVSMAEGAPGLEGVPTRKRKFVAKLSDFGSIIPLEIGAGSTRYYGTPMTNAPEVERQLSQQPLHVEGMLKCDAYSLGLLYVHVLAGRLDECLTTKDTLVLEHALGIIQGLNLEHELEAPMSSALNKLLQWDANDRISDISVLFGSIGQLTTGAGRTPKNVERSLELLVGRPDYFQYGWADTAFTEEYIQKLSFADLQKLATSNDQDISGKALFELAFAHALGFGTQSSTDSALDRILCSAKKGYLPARALFRTWYEGAGRGESIPIGRETQLDWLSESVAWGSFYAGTSLQRLDPVEFRLSRKEFHENGGFNQYFYPRSIPPEIGYQSARTSFLAGKSPTPQDNVNDLLEYAVIHGDLHFVEKLISMGMIDPDCTNQYGESLVLLCCKGGHFDTLKTLVEAGAKATSRSASGTTIRDCPLQWLIAFDDDQAEDAAEILLKAGAQDDSIAAASWDHPSVDFPGVFPRGYPLHFAAFANNDICANALLKYWPKLINQSKPDLEVETPLVHAIKMHRTTIAETFIQHNALGDVEVNQQCLRNVGAVLADEALSYNGLYFEAQGELARRCVELVAAAAPDLVNATDEYGFTPLMSAAQFHDELTVKALLRAGADVNAATPTECDHRTALNLLTESKLHCSEDTIIELLLDAGADMDKHRTTCGQTLLHLAARDNIAWIARRCLSLEADINDTDEYGQTPLHVAAMYGSVHAAQVLLQGGANTELGHHRGTYNERDWTGLTPIAAAATGSRKGFIEMLLEYQASPIARPSTRQTVFHLAVSESRPDMMAVLVSIPDLCLPPVLEMKDERHGLTALQLCAAYAEKFEHARLLVQAGADVNAIVSLEDKEFSVLDIVHYARELAIENDSAEDDVAGAVEPELEDWDKLNGYLQHYGAKRRQANDGGGDFLRMYEEAFSLD